MRSIVGEMRGLGPASPPQGSKQLVQDSLFCREVGSPCVNPAPYYFCGMDETFTVYVVWLDGGPLYAGYIASIEQLLSRAARERPDCVVEVLDLVVGRDAATAARNSVRSYYGIIGNPRPWLKTDRDARRQRVHHATNPAPPASNHPAPPADTPDPDVFIPWEPSSNDDDINFWVQPPAPAATAELDW